MEGIQGAKAGAAGYCTNFFPVRGKLQTWISHGELLSNVREGATFFLRKERDFWRLYFCAASPTLLQKEAAALPELKKERVVTDVVGTEAGGGAVLDALKSVGFRPYARLQRMAGAGLRQASAPGTAEFEVGCAAKADGPAILNLIEETFDPYADQLPSLDEVEAAADLGHILVARRAEEIGGALFFETQGVASSIRFWVVAERFRALRAGSALMLHYLKTQSAVKRFTLWVNAGNTNAIRKYEHFGYAPDGLIDRILATQMVLG
ncbi:MAG: N-acetyltransferase family protein [Bryobacteraceae bacterium]